MTNQERAREILDALFDRNITHFAGHESANEARDAIAQALDEKDFENAKSLGELNEELLRKLGEKDAKLKIATKALEQIANNKEDDHGAIGWMMDLAQEALEKLK